MGVHGVRHGTRLLVVTNMYPSEQNPANGIFVKETLDAMRRTGLEVDVLVMKGRRTPFKYAAGVIRLWSRLLRRRYDLIHAYYVYSGIVARMQLSCPVVVTLCGSDVNLTSQRPFSKWLSSRVARTVVQTQRMKEILGDEAALVLPFGVSLSLFAPVSLVEARARLGLRPEAKYALFPYDPGRKGKRYELFSSAVSKVRQSVPELETLALGNLRRELVPVFMSAADVMVLTSESEGSPGTVREALACGLPVVSVPVGDVAEVLAGVDGNWICEPNANSLARGILNALAFSGRTEGRVRASEMSTEATCSRLLDLYAEVLGQVG